MQALDSICVIPEVPNRKPTDGKTVGGSNVGIVVGVQTANPANLGLQSVARAMQRCCPPHRILARKDPSKSSAASVVSDSVCETRSPLALNPSSPHHRTNISPKAVICCSPKHGQKGQTPEAVDSCATPYPACPLASEVFASVAHSNHCFLTVLSLSATA